jgi:Cys-tRNA(Pro)/Cys-tRNA(Cys) deacylase
MVAMKKTNAMRALADRGLPYDVVEYQYDADDLSVERIAGDNGLALPTIYKTLVLEGEPPGLVVALVPGHQTLDRKALAQVSGKKRVYMVPPADLFKLTGYIRGGCCPIGMTRPYPVYLDASALAMDKIYVNAGTRGILVGLDPRALAGLAGATVAPIAQEASAADGGG